jgi:hypothetical protein
MKDIITKFKKSIKHIIFNDLYFRLEFKNGNKAIFYKDGRAEFTQLTIR